MTKWIAAEEAPALLKPGMHVAIAGGVMEPQAILAALQAAPEASRGVTYIANPLPGMSKVDYASFHPEARTLTFFISAEMRDSFKAGRIDFVPVQHYQRYLYLRDQAQIDTAIIQLGPPDANGMCSHGYGLDFAPAILDKASLVIAEINAALPAPPDMAKIPLSAVDYAVESDIPVQLLPVAPIDDVAARIGAHVASLIRDGDCIETGIGAIPNAALAALGERSDLGVHSGMIPEGIKPLVDRGVITGAAKTIDKGKIVTGFAAGSRELMDWSGSCPDIAFRTAEYTHDVAVLGQIDNFVAINSAVEVDLFCQLNSEVVGGRQISGTGGSVDFMRGALRSKGGRGIVAFTATAAGGKVSRIVPQIPADGVTTALRTDADYFVTEYGIARVRGLPLDAAANALIEIAAPQFRDQLRDSWQAQYRAVRGG